MARLIEIIMTEDRVGDGTKENPVRLCIELYSKSGKLIARYDPVTQAVVFEPNNIEI